MPACSVLIPSLREDKLNACVESVSKFELLDVEILVNRDSGGIYKAVNQLVDEAKHDILVHIPDDCVVRFGSLKNIVEFVDKQDGLFEASFRVMHDGVEQENYQYYGKTFAPYICTNKKTLDAVGGMFDKNLNSFYGDPDLSLRIWQAGGRVEVCPDAWVVSNSVIDQVSVDSSRKYLRQDRDYFVKKWDPVFIKGK